MLPQMLTSNAFIFSLTSFAPLVLAQINLQVGASIGAQIGVSTPTYSPTAYILEDDYTIPGFFDRFQFDDSVDLTWGHVQYVNRSIALSHNLAQTLGDSVIIKPDTTGLYPNGGPGRPSIRMVSKKAYTHGLYILHATHMPWGCGVWPAFWLAGPNWPSNGEIDIIEGFNLQRQNGMTLHTGPNCLIAGTGQTGTLTTSDCQAYPDYYVGCSTQDASTLSYGEGFNNNGGGVYAMEWTSDWIRIWSFPSGTEPSSINNGNPDVSQFGTPDANFQNYNGNCPIDKLFNINNIVINIDFCGQGAGYTYGSTTCPQTANVGSWDSCVNFVGDNPQELGEVYWQIKSLKVYRQAGGQNVTIPITSSSQSISIPTALGSSSAVNVAEGASIPISSVLRASSPLYIASSVPSSVIAPSSSVYPGPNTISSSALPSSSPSATGRSSSVASTSSASAATRTVAGGLPVLSAALNPLASVLQSAVPAILDINCPASNGTQFTDSLGAVYSIYCYTDFANGYINFIPNVHSLADCLVLCDGQNGCSAVAWSVSNLICYLKPNSGIVILPNSDVWAAILETALSPKTTLIETTNPSQAGAVTSSTRSNANIASLGVSPPPNLLPSLSPSSYSSAESSRPDILPSLSRPSDLIASILSASSSISQGSIIEILPTFSRPSDLIASLLSTPSIIQGSPSEILSTFSRPPDLVASILSASSSTSPGSITEILPTLSRPSDLVASLISGSSIITQGSPLEVLPTISRPSDLIASLPSVSSIPSSISQGSRPEILPTLSRPSDLIASILSGSPSTTQGSPLDILPTISRPSDLIASLLSASSSTLQGSRSELLPTLSRPPDLITPFIPGSSSTAQGSRPELLPSVSGPLNLISSLLSGTISATQASMTDMIPSISRPLDLNPSPLSGSSRSVPTSRANTDLLPSLSRPSDLIASLLSGLSGSAPASQTELLPSLSYLSDLSLSLPSGLSGSIPPSRTALILSLSGPGPSDLSLSLPSGLSGPAQSSRTALLPSLSGPSDLSLSHLSGLTASAPVDSAQASRTELPLLSRPSDLVLSLPPGSSSLAQAPGTEILPSSARLSDLIPSLLSASSRPSTQATRTELIPSLSHPLDSVLSIPLVSSGPAQPSTTGILPSLSPPPNFVPSLLTNPSSMTQASRTTILPSSIRVSLLDPGAATDVSSARFLPSRLYTPSTDIGFPLGSSLKISDAMASSRGLPDTIAVLPSSNILSNAAITGTSLSSILGAIGTRPSSVSRPSSLFSEGLISGLPLSAISEANVMSNRISVSSASTLIPFSSNPALSSLVPGLQSISGASSLSIPHLCTSPPSASRSTTVASGSTVLALSFQSESLTVSLSSVSSATSMSITSQPSPTMPPRTSSLSSWTSVTLRVASGTNALSTFPSSIPLSISGSPTVTADYGTATTNGNANIQELPDVSGPVINFYPNSGNRTASITIQLDNADSMADLAQVHFLVRVSPPLPSSVTALPTLPHHGDLARRQNGDDCILQVFAGPFLIFNATVTAFTDSFNGFDTSQFELGSIPRRPSLQFVEQCTNAAQYVPLQIAGLYAHPPGSASSSVGLTISESFMGYTAGFASSRSSQAVISASSANIMISYNTVHPTISASTSSFITGSSISMTSPIFTSPSQSTCPAISRVVVFVTPTIYVTSCPGAPGNTCTYMTREKPRSSLRQYSFPSISKRGPVVTTGMSICFSCDLTPTVVTWSSTQTTGKTSSSKVASVPAGSAGTHSSQLTTITVTNGGGQSASSAAQRSDLVSGSSFSGQSQTITPSLQSLVTGSDATLSYYEASRSPFTVTVTQSGTTTITAGQTITETLASGTVTKTAYQGTITVSAGGQSTVRSVPTTSRSGNTTLPICPDDAPGTIFDSPYGGEYSLYCGYSYDDPDCAVLTSTSVGNCAQLCDTYNIQHFYESTTCLGVTFFNASGACHLKRNITRPSITGGADSCQLNNPNKGAITQVLPTSTPSATNAAPASVSTALRPYNPQGVETLIECPRDNGTTVASGPHNETFIIECGVNRPGSDAPGMPYYVSSFRSCLDACTNDPDCYDCTFFPSSAAMNPCYLKHGFTSPVSDPSCWNARLLQAPACPGDDGKSYVTNGEEFIIECYTEYSDCNFANMPIRTDTFGGCLDLCGANHPDCVSVSYTPSSPQGSCFLKSCLGPSISNSTNVWGGRLRGASSSAALTAGTPVTTVQSVPTTVTLTSIQSIFVSFTTTLTIVTTSNGAPTTLYSTETLTSTETSPVTQTLTSSLLVTTTYFTGGGSGPGGGNITATVTTTVPSGYITVTVTVVPSSTSSTFSCLTHMTNYLPASSSPGFKIKRNNHLFDEVEIDRRNKLAACKVGPAEDESGPRIM